MLAAIILSAGESSRMGSPKALLSYRGQAFLKHLLDVTYSLASASPSCTDPARSIGVVRVVLGAHADEIARSLHLDPAIIVRNDLWQSGQLSSIQAGIRSLPRDTDGMLILLVDHPLVSAGLVATLIAQFYQTGRPVVVPTFRGKRGHPVIFASSLYGELLAAPENVGARAVVWAHADEITEVPTDEEGVLLNLNEPAAVQRALS